MNITEKLIFISDAHRIQIDLCLVLNLKNKLRRFADLNISFWNKQMSWSKMKLGVFKDRIEKIRQYLVERDLKALALFQPTSHTFQFFLPIKSLLKGQRQE